MIDRKELPEYTPDLSNGELQQLLKRQVCKDQDLLYLMQYRNQNMLNISLQDRRRMMNTIKDDIDYLESNNIMDYSLLVAVEDFGKLKKFPDQRNINHEIQTTINEGRNDNNQFQPEDNLNFTPDYESINHLTARMKASTFRNARVSSKNKSSFYEKANDRASSLIPTFGVLTQQEVPQMS